MQLIAELGDCQGPMIGVSTACTASAHAIGEAYRRIQEGDAKLMVVGGFDALTSWLDVLGFSLLGALTDEYNDDPEHASRPFDAKRSGFVLGEGAIVAVLEEREAAEARGARIYAEVVGYGSSLNAYRITDAPPDGGGAILAMGSALKESGLGTDEIDYVVAHGTGTPGNDLSETMAIKEVFGDDAYALTISSRQVDDRPPDGGGRRAEPGDRLLRDARLDGAAHDQSRQSGPEARPRLPAERRARAQVRAAMLNAFAFGGTNASLVVRNPDYEVA